MSKKEDCKQTFADVKNLKKHIISKHKETLTHQCVACDDTFSSKVLLNKHAKDHVSFSPKTFKGVCQRI